MKITRSQLAQIIMEELGELNEETEAWRRNAAISKIEQFFLDVRGYSAAHEDAEVPVLFDEDWGEIVGRGGAMDQLENVRWLDKPLTRCPISRPDDGHRPKADELPRDCEERIEYNQKESYEALRARIEVVDNQWDLAIGKNKSIMQWITSPAGDRYLRMISTLVDDLIWLPDTGPSDRPGNVGSSGMSVSPLPTDPPIPTFQNQLMEMIHQELREGPQSPYYSVHQAVANMPGYKDFGNVSIGGGAQRYTFESEDDGKTAKNELSRRFRSFTFHWDDLGQYVQVSGG